MIIIPGDDGANRVLGASGLDDEPEQHVDHVDDPDGAVEVESITEHKLPIRELLDLERAQGAVHCQRELKP